MNDASMHDIDIDIDIDQLSEQQHGVVGRRQLREVGATKSALRHMWHTSRRWEAITDQVARRVGAPRTDGQRLMTAVLDAGGDHVASHDCGARWWGHRGCTLDPLVLTATSASRRRTRLARVHHVSYMAPHWTTELDGIPIVRPEMLAMQMFDVASFGRAERITEWLWSERLLSGPSLHRFLIELGERGRNGTAGLREYLRHRPRDYVPVASGLEGRAKQLLDEAMIPVRKQVDLGAEHWTGRVDFLHATLPLVIEIQSARHHKALVDELADAARIAHLVRDGFEVVELTDDDVWTRPWRVKEKVEEGIDRIRCRSAEK